jgi:hypothetical protein
MKFPGVIALWLGAAGLALVPPTLAQPTTAPAIPVEQQVEEIAARLEGVMDTSAQARVKPNAPNVRMTTCRIQVLNANATDATFLYQEQAMATNLGKPYRQRFLQLTPSRSSQMVRSLAFRPPNPAALINFCDRANRDRIVNASDLGTPVCTVFLKRSGERYIGNTPADGCPANVRGAVRITNHIVLHTDGMDTWDRGYDANGKQVWGAKAESYQFRRIKP